MITITFKLDSPDAKRLKNEPSKNRRFNNHSEILRTLVKLYLNDHIVSRAIHEGMKRKYGEVIDEGVL